MESPGSPNQTRPHIGIAFTQGEKRYAFEFRHASWLGDPVYRLPAEHNVALCWAESEKFEVPEELTAGFVYFRLRKADYSPKERKAIAATAQKLATQGRDVFLFFKYEDTPEGALHAQELLAQR